ncbi:hypothetical protein M407DRAFT_242186, partial [Tulasnella calospora MUT 4182]
MVGAGGRRVDSKLDAAQPKQPPPNQRTASKFPKNIHATSAIELYCGFFLGLGDPE